MQVIETKQAPAPIGPYSQAIMAGDTLYVSGQIALNPETGEMEQATLKEEAHRVMKNIQAVLAASGMGFQDIAKCTIFILDMADFAEVNEVYGAYFYKTFPARETVAVKGLPKGARVEISCIAVKSS
jgi:2-iminobutanoate/2-iminopropanoate deaminase